VIQDIKEFKSLENEWDSLFFSINNYSVFQSFIFNYYSWKEILSSSSSNSLFIIKIMQEGMTIGFFPLYNDKRNTLRFINDIHCDFCDLIFCKDIDFSSLFHFILNDCSQQKIQLINLKKDSVLRRFSLECKDINISCFFSESYTEFKVDKGIFPDNYNRLLCKQRGEIRRILKKNSNYKHKLLDSSNDDFPINDILILKEKMIKNGIRSNNFLSVNQLKLIEILYKKKYIEISCIEDNEVRAILFILKNQYNLLFWIDLYDSSVYTSTLHNYISYIRFKSLNSQIFINLGRGKYKWKIAKFKPNIRDLYTLNIFSSRFIRISYLIKNYFISMITLIYRNFKK